MVVIVDLIQEGGCKSDSCMSRSDRSKTSMRSIDSTHHVNLDGTAVLIMSKIMFLEHYSVIHKVETSNTVKRNHKKPHHSGHCLTSDLPRLCASSLAAPLNRYILLLPVPV
jgi:hypothetical protein